MTHSNTTSAWSLFSLCNLFPNNSDINNDWVIKDALQDQILDAAAHRERFNTDKCCLLETILRLYALWVLSFSSYALAHQVASWIVFCTDDFTVHINIAFC